MGRTPNTKIGVDLVEEIRRMLAALPEHESKEMNKLAAVRSLARDILAVQSKGYTRKAIAKMLTDTGLVVSEGVLSNAMHSAKARARRRRAKRQRDQKKHVADTTQKRTATSGESLDNVKSHTRASTA